MAFPRFTLSVFVCIICLVFIALPSTHNVAALPDCTMPHWRYGVRTPARPHGSMVIECRLTARTIGTDGDWKLDGSSKLTVQKQQEYMGTTWAAVTDGDNVVRDFKESNDQMAVTLYKEVINGTSVHIALDFAIHALKPSDFGTYKCQYKADTRLQRVWDSDGKAVVKSHKPSVNVKFALYYLTNEAPVALSSIDADGTKVYDIRDISVLSRYKAVCDAYGVMGQGKHTLKITSGLRTIPSTRTATVNRWVGPEVNKVHYVNASTRANPRSPGLKTELGSLLTCQSWTESYNASIALRRSGAVPRVICSKNNTMVGGEVTMQCNASSLTADDDTWWTLKKGNNSPRKMENGIMRIANSFTLHVQASKTRIGGSLSYKSTLEIDVIRITDSVPSDYVYTFYAKNKFGNVSKVVDFTSGSNSQQTSGLYVSVLVAWMSLLYCCNLS